ncbi:hypothetical protein [Luteibacter sp. 22Crub2.1]|uniref:hypothetical protein n=1 Tax=Luteibacter sp. 22Crub2.1 TaxID=1283288 RepID=UPI0009A74BB3|nr:hypothetical protein [Luteibacter sp. 22Crub2.1]SKB73847.1 hypothetical protein SAMN05660880_02378 [Luteibacter sp. 22Crub2.1]
MIAFTETQRRDCIVALGRSCEHELILADNVARTGTVRERFVGTAEHKRNAALYASAAFTWAKREVLP